MWRTSQGQRVSRQHGECSHGAFLDQRQAVHELRWFLHDGSGDGFTIRGIDVTTVCKFHCEALAEKNQGQAQAPGKEGRQIQGPKPKLYLFLRLLG